MGALRTAFASPSDISEIGLHATIAPSQAPNTLKVDLRIAVPDLLLQESGGQYDGHLTVMFSTRTATGPEGPPVGGNLDPHLTKEQHDTYLKDGVPISNEYPIGSATKFVRLIVADRATDLVGSLTIPVALPK
jgi:hypothetical protein